MTSKEINKQVRNDIGFVNDIDDIINKRIKKGKEDFKHPKTRTRITQAITRHINWGMMKEDIINNKLKDDTGMIL